MTLDIIFYFLGVIFVILGFLGCILPILPGLPLSYIGILFLHFTSQVQFSTSFLIGWLIVVLVIQLLDYILPIWGTKQFGGTKYGVKGSAFGLILGLLFSPWGIILGPFIGAVIGEIIGGKEFSIALKSGFGSFIGFLVGTLTKFIVAGILAFFVFKELIMVVF